METTRRYPPRNPSHRSRPNPITSGLISSVNRPLHPQPSASTGCELDESDKVPIATVNGSWLGNWLTLDDPPTVLYGVSDAGIGVFNLHTLHRQLFRLPVARSFTVLAVRRIHSGFLVAYTVHDTCAVTESPEGIPPSKNPHNYGPHDRQRPANLCFVDVPDAP